MSHKFATKRVEELNEIILAEKKRITTEYLKQIVPIFLATFGVTTITFLLSIDTNIKLMVAIVLMLTAFILSFILELQETKKKEQLEDTIVLPFIKSLKEEKIFIQDIEFDEVDDIKYNYITPEEERTYNHLGQEIKTQDDNWGIAGLSFGELPVIFDLLSGEAPYKSYRYLPEDIEGYLDRGNYMEEIHLPYDYPRPTY